MFDRTDIRAAVEAGAIGDEAAKRFEAFLKARNDPERMLDPENLRFLSNFNDVFLTIGIVILMVGLSTMSFLAFSNLFGLSNLHSVESIEGAEAVASRIRMTAIATPVPVLAGAWLLAEYFCGKRRLLLPSMALAIVICGAAAFIALGLYSLAIPASNVEYVNPWSILWGMGYVGFGAALVAALAFFWRFRLPFSLFLVASAAAALFYTAIAQVTGVGIFAGGVVVLISGLATLAAAISFDMRDPSRSTRNTDHAFWLHMAAAPQIIVGVRYMVIGANFAPGGATDAIVMLSVLLIFSLLSLALNRRALIVSGLITFGTALGVLVSQFGGNGVNSVMLTALIIGGAIVLLGGGWRTARRAVLKLFPQEGTFGRIFPPEPA